MHRDDFFTFLDIYGFTEEQDDEPPAKIEFFIALVCLGLLTTI